MQLGRLLPIPNRRRPDKRLAAHSAAVAPLFDPAFYLAQNTDVARSGQEPLAHYVSNGWQEGRQPHPLFDAAWYLDINDDVRAAGVDPLRHYLTSGWQEGRRPHVLFDNQRYEARYGVGPASGQNPLLYYLDTGWKLGHEPHLLFKTTWYLCENQDVAQAGAEPFVHYLTAGWRTGRSPHPAFDPSWYLEQHNDVARLAPEPLTHYQKFGWEEGRAPNEALEELRKEKARLVARDGLTPLELYVTTDAYRRDREPELFDPVYYRKANRDISGLNDTALYQHFVTTGYAEGRLGKPIRPRRVRAEPNRPSRGPRPRTPVTGIGKPKYSAPLVIAGFHRSGTSMTANLLFDAGLHVGDELLGARPSNPYGHFEDREIIAFHDGLLRNAGQNWQTATDFPAVVTPRDWRFMVTYGSRKSAFRAWGFKDPRVCLFLPQWHATFPDLSLLYIYRPCIECVQSIRKRAAHDFVRDEAPELNLNFFTQDDVAIRMYLNYSRQALRFMEAFDGRMKVIALTDLLGNRDIVSEIRRDWDYQLADALPFDVYDGKSLTLAGANEIVNNAALLDEVAAVERRFEAMLG